MAIERVPPLTVPEAGIEVASPDATHGTHTFRSASNFNKIIDGLINLVVDHAGSLGEIQYIKEWWEDPAIVGETEEFPCFYVIPLHLDKDWIRKDRIYESVSYMGDPLAKSVLPVSCMAYYKYVDIKQPLRDVRGWGWNYWDILLSDKLDYALPSGIQAMTPHVGWHIAGTNYIIQWWELKMKITAIL